MDTDGSNQKQITLLGNVLDGRLAANTVVIRRGISDYRTWQLFAFPYSDAAPITDPIPGIPNTNYTVDYDVNPAGTKIVFTTLEYGWNTGTNFHLYVLDIATHIKTEINYTPGYHNVCTYWGRDGFIYLVLSPYGWPYGQQVARIPEAGKNNAVFLAPPLSQYPALGPLGRVAYLTNYPAMSIAVMDANGANRAPLPNSPTGVSGRIEWDNSGDAIYYTTQADEAWKVSVNGGRPVRIATNVQASSLDFGTCSADVPLEITTASLPSGMVGQSYSYALTATGGTPPYDWQVMNGRLPTGLTLDPFTGTVFGVPGMLVSGTLLTFKVTDSGTPQQSSTVALVLNIAQPALTITTMAVPDPRVGIPYSQTIRAMGGSAPYRWQLLNGSLPSGLILNPSTGEISGTPTQVATRISFMVQATDSSIPVPTTATQTYRMSVPATP